MADEPGRLYFCLRGSPRSFSDATGTFVAWLEAWAADLRQVGLEPSVSASHPAIRGATPRVWQRLIDALRGPDPVSFSVSTGSGEGLPRRYLTYLSVTPDLRTRSSPVHDITLRTRVGETSPVAAEASVRTCETLAVASGLSQGLMLPWSVDTRGAGVEDTVSERFVEDDHTPYGPRALEVLLRGAGWAMWMTERHIQGLGGVERIHREAPVHRVVEHPAGLWLEATADPFDFTQSHLEQLERFITPILPRRGDLPRLDPEPATAQGPYDAGQGPADRYRDYTGPPVPLAELFTDFTATLNIYVHAELAAEQRQALRRLLYAWLLDSKERYDVDGGLEAEGRLKEYTLVTRWLLSFRGRGVEEMLAELTRRLGGWSARWGVEIRRLSIGSDDDLAIEDAEAGAAGSAV